MDTQLDFSYRFFEKLSREIIFPLVPFLMLKLGADWIIVIGVEIGAIAFFVFFSGIAAPRYRKEGVWLMGTTISRWIIATASSWGAIALFRIFDGTAYGFIENDESRLEKKIAMILGPLLALIIIFFFSVKELLYLSAFLVTITLLVSEFKPETEYKAKPITLLPNLAVVFFIVRASYLFSELFILVLYLAYQVFRIFLRRLFSSLRDEKKIETVAMLSLALAAVLASISSSQATMLLSFALVGSFASAVDEISAK